MMNENLNLVEILKDCPKGTKLYSTIFGDVRLINILYSTVYPIIVSCNDCNTEDFTADGKLRSEYDGECTLFPSRTQRNWAEFKPKKPKFDPKTLCPFDKVLVRDSDERWWRCALYSHTRENKEYKYMTMQYGYKCCIPYNEETKHLAGRTDEAPEYYRYWEE